MKDIFFMERDPYAPIRHCYPIDDVLYSKKSEYQEILVVKSPHFGKMLILDGVVQVDEKYEHLYHEMLVHVPMFSHPCPEDVLIIGGGDGGSLREVLKHKCVKRVVLVDIDKEVIETSKRFFPTLSSGFEDSRAIILNEDGYKYIKECSGEFDVVIVDSTDPVGFAHVLITEEFFRHVYNALKPEGIYAGQTESLLYHGEMVSRIQNDLRKVFPVVDLFTSVIPIYAGYWWTFSIGSKKYDVRKPARTVDVETKFYSPSVHEHAFLPEDVYKKFVNM